MEDLIIPFIFIPHGDPEPKDWLAKHPGAIKIPARMVPRKGEAARQGPQLQMDINSVLARYADQAIGPSDNADTQTSPYQPPVKPSKIQPPTLSNRSDPIAAYLQTTDGINDFIAKAAVAPAASPATGAPSEATASAENNPIQKVSEKQTETSSNGAATKTTPVHYRALVVKLPDGTTYMPKTTVKNTGQANQLGLPVGAEVPVLVPPNINPEDMVKDWSSGSWKNNMATFALTWSPEGSNDYKKNFSPIYDAYGNFEYAATGAAAGYSRKLLQNMGDDLKFGQNDPVNKHDINLGYDAIEKHGELSTVDYVINTPTHAVRK